MNNLVVILGSVLLTAIILSIPVFTVISLVQGWHIFIQVFLIGVYFFEFVFIFIIILSESEDT